MSWPEYPQEGFSAKQSKVSDEESSVCWKCSGSGSCADCDGTGTFQFAGGSRRCGTCKGTGVCQACG